MGLRHYRKCISSEMDAFTLLLTAKVVFSFLWQVTESVEQEFPHFIIDQFLLGSVILVINFTSWCANWLRRRSVVRIVGNIA